MNPVKKKKKSFLEEEVNEILSKLGLPDVFTKTILRNLENEEENRRKKKGFLEYVIYKTLNDNSIPISIKELSSISGISDIDIYNMQEDNKSLILKPCELLEKYCSYLGLNYKTYSLINKELPSQNISGHNPLTITAATI